MSQMTFDFLKMPEFERRFPNARPPEGSLPTTSRDGIIQLLEAEQDGKYYLFIVRNDANGRIWSRHLRALFQELPVPMIAVSSSTSANAHRQARESLQWHFVDVTAPEDDFPTGDGEDFASIPRRPIPPSRPESEKRRPEEAA